MTALSLFLFEILHHEDVHWKINLVDYLCAGTTIVTRPYRNDS